MHVEGTSTLRAEIIAEFEKSNTNECYAEYIAYVQHYKYLMAKVAAHAREIGLQVDFYYDFRPVSIWTPESAMEKEARKRKPCPHTRIEHESGLIDIDWVVFLKMILSRVTKTSFILV